MRKNTVRRRAEWIYLTEIAVSIGCCLILLFTCGAWNKTLEEHPKSFAAVRVRNNHAKPLLLHYVWVQNRRSAFPRDLTSLQFLSIASALNKLRPVGIYLHTNTNFSGPLWASVKESVLISPIKPSPAIYGTKIMHIEQYADLLKLEIAYELGGFIADFDVYFTGRRSEFTELSRHYECVFGMFYRKGRSFFALGNFACNSRSEFINKIRQEYRYRYRGYKCYSDSDAMPFLYNCCLFPYLLYNTSKTYQRTIHIEERLLRMFEKRNEFLYRNQKVSWRGSFNVHSGYEGRDLSLEEIWAWNSTFGELLRAIYREFYSNRPVPVSLLTQPYRYEGNLVTFSYNLTRRAQMPFMDLTAAESMALLSAIKYSTPDIIRLYSSEMVSGPWWYYLTEYAVKSGIAIVNVVRSERHSETAEQDPMRQRNSFEIGFDMFFFGETEKNFHLARNSSSQGEAQGKPTISSRCRSLYIFPSSRMDTFHQDGYSKRNGILQVPPAVQKDYFTLDSMRNLRSCFGEILRFIYFGETRVITDHKLYNYPCGQD